MIFINNTELQRGFVVEFLRSSLVVPVVFVFGWLDMFLYLIYFVRFFVLIFNVLFMKS